MTTEGSPEITIDRPEVSWFATKTSRVLCISPLFPNIHARCAQVCFVGVAGKKPEQLFRDPAEWNFLGRNYWKAFAQIKTCLIAEMRDGTDAGAVLMLDAVFKN